MKTSADVRTTFLDYFQDRGHRVVKSGPLVPGDDPTLLFTNAGMNQFKDTFLGLEKRDYNRATTCQKCMRVSGKHNDLETVGRTPLHHTFFEMLGNFSFGDYFKKEAVEFAWELCTEVYGLAPEQLYATVFEEDDEAYSLWKDHIGVPQDRVLRMGEKENFWAMGDTGPCGPCAELHFDLGTSPLGHPDCAMGCECGRYVEIWNLVFMQFSRDSSGAVSPLPSPSIDTGMGLERITAVLQGHTSNYDTDLFRPIIEEATRLTGSAYGQDDETDVSLKILADHSRACTFLISDGVIPGNEGRGYVLRKILRRAIRHGKTLGQEEPFLFTLAALVSHLMKDAYPEIESQGEYVAKLVKNEEERFQTTLRHGMGLFEEISDQAARKSQRQLPGKELFKLYDTYGFPLDLAREIAEERGLGVDEKGFFVEMEKQRERARASWKGEAKTFQPVYQELAKEGLETEFTGYTDIEEVPGSVLALLQDDRSVDVLEEGQTGEVVLDQSPFYAEAGGQVGDKGTLENESVYARVEDTYSPAKGLRLSKVKMQRGRLKKGDAVQSSVLTEGRLSTARNHTATHLMHASLRQVLGEHVKQAGSLVAPDRLRFDFTHYRQLSPGEIGQIERQVNSKIRENIEVQTAIRDLEEAIKQGAMALFGEKYSPQVRVVTVPGFSAELCGGTHVSRTGDIALFKVVSEGSTAAGVRRIEAITGELAMERFSEEERLLGELSDRLRVAPADLPEAVDRTVRELREAQKQTEALRLKLAQQESIEALEGSREIQGVRVLSQKVQDLDRNALRQLADQLKNKLKSGVVVLGMPSNGKVSLVAMVSSDLTEKIRADDLIRKLAPLVGGGGGGKSDLAEAGGKDPSRLDEALKETYRFVEETLGVGSEQ